MRIFMICTEVFESGIQRNVETHKALLPKEGLWGKKRVDRELGQASEKTAGGPEYLMMLIFFPFLLSPLGLKSNRQESHSEGIIMVIDLDNVDDDWSF